MIIREVIWLKQFADKIERKHRVSQAEVDETLANQPPVRRMRRGAREGEGEDLYRAVDRPMQDATCPSFSFTRGKGRALVISARESDSKELRSYGKHKK